MAKGLRGPNLCKDRNLEATWALLYGSCLLLLLLLIHVAVQTLHCGFIAALGVPLSLIALCTAQESGCRNRVT